MSKQISEEEYDFTINCDIKYRMGQEADSEIATSDTRRTRYFEIESNGQWR
ncbi:MAG TPA: hypothetical protein PKH07_14625 [bacterium]|nr:hypothetical protein [bacterium]